MTLDEAIKWIDRIAAQDEESGRPECVKAEKLGIEALKQMKAERTIYGFKRHVKMSGETEEAKE